ncbi:peroxidase 11 [Nymphaea colorata]|nr:peroxidase 11 [Nymphaea colorata]
MARNILAFFLITALAITAHAQVPPLSLDYYSKTCPSVLHIVRREMECAVVADRRTAASILRLHFHDCFVQGCDGSVLLDDTRTLIGERSAIANKDSLRGFRLVDRIKTMVEARCPGIVSCADILAIAARDAVVLTGGPCWDVPLGRRDSTTASLARADVDLPLPSHGLVTLLAKFQNQGLSLTDMVALVGAHTIGMSRCTNYRDRIHGDFKDTIGANPLSQAYLYNLKSACPPVGNDDNITSLDYLSPALFDNSFYQILTRGEGLLSSDQAMYSSLLSKDTKPLITEYAMDVLAFFKQFSESMVKLGNITDPVSYSTGEVRKKCRFVNI